MNQINVHSAKRLWDEMDSVMGPYPGSSRDNTALSQTIQSAVCMSLEHSLDFGFLMMCRLKYTHDSNYRPYSYSTC